MRIINPIVSRGGGGGEPPEVIILASGLTLTPESATCKVNQSVSVTATVTPAEATNKKVNWNQTSGPATLVTTPSGENSEVLTINAGSVEGDYVFSCSTMDGSGLIKTYSLKVEPLITASDEDTINNHKNTYRNENLIGGSHFESIDELAKYVKAGNFDDIYVGDYINIQFPRMNETTVGASASAVMRVMDINYLMGKGDTALNKPHLILMPDNCIGSGRMNTSDTNTSGYKGSRMHQTIMPAYKTQFENVFGAENIITYRDQLSTNNSTGVTWTDVTIRLPSEISIFGSRSYSPNADGNFNTQLAGFKLQSGLKQKSTNGLTVDGSGWWWTSSVYSDSSYYFVLVYSDGSVDSDHASVRCGLAPVVVFG